MLVFFRRISPLKIVKEHFSGLTDDSKEGEPVSKIEVTLVVLLPAIVAFALVYLKGGIGSQLNGNIVTGFSILAGLLANTTVLLITRYDAIGDSERGAYSPKRTLIRETFYHSSYGLLLCLFCIIFSMTYEIIKSNHYNLWGMHLELSKIWSFLILYLVFSFIHTVFVVLKRFTRVIDGDLN